MNLFIKNMVCDRCILVVRQALVNLGFVVESIYLGGASITPDPDPNQLALIHETLIELGFVPLDKEKDKLIEKIKNLIIEKVHHSDLMGSQTNFSEYLSEHLHREYTYLSRIFSEDQDLTLEKLIIQQKIEKVKELLTYGELNMNEIAFKMGYSSSAHLSAQFKSLTHQTPSQYKASGQEPRKPLDKLGVSPDKCPKSS